MYRAEVLDHNVCTDFPFQSPRSKLPSYFIYQILYIIYRARKGLVVVVIEEAVSHCAPDSASCNLHRAGPWRTRSNYSCLPHKQDAGSKQCGTLGKKQSRYSNCRNKSASGYLGNEEAFVCAELRIRFISDVCDCISVLNFFFGSNYWANSGANLFLMLGNNSAS